YKAGEYDQAINALKNEKTADSFYNQGNALAKKGQLEQALNRYQQALALKKEDQDILHNKNLVEKALEKQQKEKQQQQKKNGSESKKDDNSPSKKGDKSQPSDNTNSKEQASEPQKNKEPNPESEKDKNKEAKAQKLSQKKPSEKQPQKQKSDYKLDENEQATQQWLNRIPDDPSGLLRRKFEYQYKLRQRNSEDNEKSW
ncbi:MAG: tetratricopeptide repeat protein, partial [Methylococcales bacterium]|nr:tetratricopeptide repeat protein [Methylococcales bacterium]